MHACRILLCAQPPKDVAAQMSKLAPVTNKKYVTKDFKKAIENRKKDTLSMLHNILTQETSQMSNQNRIVGKVFEQKDFKNGMGIEYKDPRDGEWRVGVCGGLAGAGR